uniref:Si:dkey-188g12.1 n=1 Tax=Hucho hucho TaxID=62062 RepID=A0A4W5LXA5_9TELE
MNLVVKQKKMCMNEDEEELFSKEIEEIRKFSLGNQLRVGFFGPDASVQTDVSELPTVKLLSDHTAELIKNMDTLKKEICLKIKFTQAHYESKLQQEAESLYISMNDKVKSLENHHKEKVKVIRKSYQQQFNDAIHVIRGSYKNYYLKKGENVAGVASDTGRLKDLMNEIQEKNLKIKCMSEQLREYEERVFTKISCEAVDDPDKEWLRQENQKLQDDIDSMHIVMDQVRNSLEAKEQQLEDLAHNLKDVKVKLEDEKKALQKMTSDYDHLKVQLSIEKDTARKKMKSLKQELEKEIQIIEDLRKSEKHAVEKEVNEKLSAEKEKQKREILAEEAALKAQAAEKQPVFQVAEGGEELIQQLNELKKMETLQKQDIEKLQKQLFRCNRIWEKKFEILKASFHAIKDEMYLRQTLQRQAASLQHASVNYMMDSAGSYQSPVYKGFKMPSSYATGTPLPNIGTGGFQKIDRTGEIMDISVLSGKRTDCSESQMESGDEEELCGILPLPCPLSHTRQTASLTSAICTPSK